MANVFCLAIEEARPIRNELSFEGDRFVVRRDALEKPSQDETPTTLEETVAPLQFRMTQLFRLTEIFRRVSSQGTLTERALVYLLEDLVTHGKDDGEESLVPCSWYELRPEEISSLVNETFTSEERIDWREFVIYAMELPMPSHEELLAARDRFRAQDPDLKEVVSSDHCRRTPLWFLENTETPPRIYELLRDGYQRNRDDLCEEEFDFPSRSLASIYEGAPRSKASRSRSSPWKPNDSDIAEETTRATLARELLCRMYSVSRRAVNYTAMLLAFCKDEDPREGFGKALALAMGSRVCTDVEEGDKYAEELLERKRLARETALTLEAFQVAEDVLDGLMSTIASKISALEENRPQNGTTFSHWLSAENLDASTKTESSDLLPVETTTEPVVELETSRNIPDEREKSSSFSSLAIAESGSRVRGADQESIVHWIPRDVCLTVLAACLPYHVTQPEISETSKSLREGIALVYDELRDESLSDEEDVVLAHRLLSHDFVKRLLNSTSKFTLKHMGIIVRDILGERRDGKARR